MKSFKLYLLALLSTAGLNAMQAPEKDKTEIKDRPSNRAMAEADHEEKRYAEALRIVGNKDLWRKCGAKAQEQLLAIVEAKGKRRKLDAAARATQDLGAAREAGRAQQEVKKSLSRAEINNLGHDAMIAILENEADFEKYDKATQVRLDYWLEDLVTQGRAQAVYNRDLNKVDIYRIKTEARKLRAEGRLHKALSQLVADPGEATQLNDEAKKCKAEALALKAKAHALEAMEFTLKIDAFKEKESAMQKALPGLEIK